MSDLYQRIGGDELRRVIEDFYGRVFADPMIGFLFAGKNKERLIHKEWELVAGLLEETLEAHRVDPDVRRRWLEHARSLRAQLTSDPEGSCPPSGPSS